MEGREERPGYDRRDGKSGWVKRLEVRNQMLEAKTASKVGQLLAENLHSDARRSAPPVHGVTVSLTFSIEASSI
jgi:hypothetical protein